MVRFTLNGQAVISESPPDTPLLWVLREELQLTGTKFGCGIAQCGACTVHLDGTAARACVTPVTAVANRHITTIEGLATPVGAALKSSWEAEQVPQCGYCQSGQIMQAARAAQWVVRRGCALCWRMWLSAVAGEERYRLMKDSVWRFATARSAVCQPGLLAWRMWQWCLRRARSR